LQGLYKKAIYVLLNGFYHQSDRIAEQFCDYAADIWIETIPYKETRAYVAAILTYALIYQSRLQSGEVRINDFMRDPAL
jgi:hypothetical protein